MTRILSFTAWLFFLLAIVALLAGATAWLSGAGASWLGVAVLVAIIFGVVACVAWEAAGSIREEEQEALAERQAEFDGMTGRPVVEGRWPGAPDLMRREDEA